MRFSLTTFLVAIGWMSVLAGAVLATIRLPQAQTSSPAILVGFIAVLYLAFVSIGSFYDRPCSRPFWRGCAIAGLGFLTYLVLPVPTDSNYSILKPAGGWLFNAINPSYTGQLETWYAGWIAKVLSLWLIPIFASFGGFIASWFRMRNLNNDT